MYCIAGKFGGKVWRIDSFWAFGERKFGELIHQPIGYCANMDGFSLMNYGQFTTLSPPPKLSRYTVTDKVILVIKHLWLQITHYLLGTHIILIYNHPLSSVNL